jgi:hypothetical protein
LIALRPIHTWSLSCGTLSESCLTVCDHERLPGNGGPRVLSSTLPLHLQIAKVPIDFAKRDDLIYHIISVVTPAVEKCLI